jgi:hypothetical protein
MNIQKCMPGLYPTKGLAYDCPISERKIYAALEKALPKNWYGWHSLKVRTERFGIAETDFVIADPNQGILVLEVKGGFLEKWDGHWYQNDHLLRKSPLEQAKGFCRGLVSKFREREIVPPRIGPTVCFCDTTVEDQPTQADLEGLVIGLNHLPYLHEMLHSVFIKAISPFKEKKTSGNWIKALHEMWCESWVPEMRLSIVAKKDEERRIRLDKDQFSALWSLRANDMVLVKGGAGTGKTLLARELAKCEVKDGRRVLLLCFTDALGSELSREFEDANITASPIGKFAVKLLRDKGHEIKESYDPEFWEPVTLQAAVDGIPDEEELWDTVIVDEGQDMGENQWLLIQGCAKEKKRIWIFYDGDQAYWKERRVPEELKGRCSKYLLEKPYRCPEEIQALADAYCGNELDVDLVKGAREEGIIKIRKSKEEWVHRDVGNEIGDLLREGFERNEIAVISLRGMMLAENIMHEEELGGQRIVKATDEDACENIVCDTFLRFKGLERPAVIVTDLRFVSDNYGVRMNVALTRATGVVRIVGAEMEIDKDEILKKIAE